MLANRGTVIRAFARHELSVSAGGPYLSAGAPELESPAFTLDLQRLFEVARHREPAVEKGSSRHNRRHPGASGDLASKAWSNPGAAAFLAVKKAPKVSSFRKARSAYPQSISRFGQ